MRGQSIYSPAVTDRHLSRINPHQRSSVAGDNRSSPNLPLASPSAAIRSTPDLSEVVEHTDEGLSCSRVGVTLELVVLHVTSCARVRHGTGDVKDG